MGSIFRGFGVRPSLKPFRGSRFAQKIPISRSFDMSVYTHKNICMYVHIYIII